MFIKLEYYGKQFDKETRLHTSEPILINTGSISHVTPYDFHLGKNTYEPECGFIVFVDGSTTVLTAKSYVDLLQAITQVKRD